MIYFGCVRVFETIDLAQVRRFFGSTVKVDDMSVVDLFEVRTVGHEY